MGEGEIISTTARNPFIDAKPYALKAQDISAQGNALGSNLQIRVALKGRDIKFHFPRCQRSYVTPLQGYIFIVFPYPGRCPGLICNGPSGLKTMFGVVLLKMTGKRLRPNPDVREKNSPELNADGRRQSTK